MSLSLDSGMSLAMEALGRSRCLELDDFHSLPARRSFQLRRDISQQLQCSTPEMLHVYRHHGRERAVAEGIGSGCGP